MPQTDATKLDSRIIDRDGVAALIEELRRSGYQVVGPTIRDGAIVYDEIRTLADLPAGWTDEQDGGHYRLRRRDDEALFGYVVGPHSWKKFLHPPVLRLWQAEKTDDGFRVHSDADDPPPYAFFGVRSCELHAIAVQDKVFLDGPFVDRHYQARRQQAFIVAVNCVHPGGTCFCVSMATGPRVGPGFDLALTELCTAQRHAFLLQIGSDRGRQVADSLPTQPATPDDLQFADELMTRAAMAMGRRMDSQGVRELLYRNYEHPRWDDVADRCLTCANCTMVCPTCFCTTVEDVTDLTGDHAERWRKWDSCFTMDFSYLHGGSVRASTRARYRQWLTHKLATWIDQFGTSGCVGCGRCITWCPVGIDLTEEVEAIRRSETANSPATPPSSEDDHGITGPDPR